MGYSRMGTAPIHGSTTATKHGTLGAPTCLGLKHSCAADRIPVSCIKAVALPSDHVVRFSADKAILNEDQAKEAIRSKVESTGRYVDPAVLSLKVMLAHRIRVIPAEVSLSVRCLCSK